MKCVSNHLLKNYLRCRCGVNNWLKMRGREATDYV